jgi:hypothetical protein
MTTVSTPRSTLTLPSDLALEAAAVFDRFLGSLSPEGIPEAPDPAAWAAIEANGWLDAGRGSGEDSFDLLDLAELATAWGRHLLPAPFVTTLLARRHLGDAAPDASFGLTYALGPAAGALVPYGALPGCTFLEEIGRGSFRAGTLAPTAIDAFAPTLPLAVAASGTRIDDELVRETAVLHAAELVGSVDAVMRTTIEYANVRVVYGQELGRFQAIRFRMADVHRDIEAMRGLLLASALGPREDAPASVRLVARMARRAVEACLQTHGAIGFTWELGLHRHVRHAMAVERLMDQVVRARGARGVDAAGA